jgi:hypothetical protein
MDSSMSSRNGRYRLSCDFQRRNGLFMGDGWESVEELFQRIAGLQIVEEALNRNTSTHEDRRTAHDLRVCMNDFMRVVHAAILLSPPNT